MKSFLGAFLTASGIALTLVSTPGQAMDGYLVCGPCQYYDPADQQCHDAPGCNVNNMPEGRGYDVGQCASWYPDGGNGHAETIIGCCGATSLSWPQVLCRENQYDVSK